MTQQMLIEGEKGWQVSPADAETVLRVTGRDSKLNFEAARRVLAMGAAAVREADVAMRKCKGWTLHWSKSQGKFFYSNREQRSGPYTKGEDCPFGWAVTAAGTWYFHITNPNEPQSAPPESATTASVGGKRPRGEGGGEEAVPRPAVRAKQLGASLADRVWDLVAADERVGFPLREPAVDKNPHGWFFPPHKVVMSNIMTPQTRCIMELGSWLGKSTRFIVSRAPNAFVMCIDLWSNDHIRDDPHYTANDGASEFMAGHAAREKQIAENIKIINEAPIGDVFMKNMWEWRADAMTRRPGVVPLKMTTFQGIELLHRHNIVPEAIYVDASHHYDDVIKELTLCRKYFPQAEICGDDWDYPPVRKAAEDCAAAEKPTPLRIHAEGGKCWTFAQISAAGLKAGREEFLEGKVSAEAQALFSRVESVLRAGDNAAALGQVLAPHEEEWRLRAVNLLYPPKGRSMLMLAAMHGRTECVRALLGAWGACAGAQTKQKGETALHLAAYGGHAPAVKLLLESGDVDTECMNEYQETALQAAQGAKKHECVALLQAAAAAAAACR